jgi:LCP family protein required for cell wall assembly
MLLWRQYCGLGNINGLNSGRYPPKGSGIGGVTCPLSADVMTRNRDASRLSLWEESRSPSPNPGNRGPVDRIAGRILVTACKRMSGGMWRRTCGICLVGVGSTPLPSHRRYWQGSSQDAAPHSTRKASQVPTRTPEVAQSPPASFRKPVAASERIKRRRGLALLAMTLLLPGSAQLVAGNRCLGRLALRIWASLWLLAVFAALLAVILPQSALAVITFGPTIVTLQVIIIMLGLGWVLLIVDAWRLAQPWDLERWGQVFSALSLAVALSVFGGFIAAISVVSAEQDMATAVFGGGGDPVPKQGRYNILLMGGDAGWYRVGLRPDSMTVASINAETGRTVLISLPGNLHALPFPSYSPLHARFPRGYRCSDGSCMLNAIYSYAFEHRDLYPGFQNPGAQATKEAVEGATGLTINYWALIDFKGFESLVDSVGGITIDVDRRFPIGGGSGKISGYVEAGKTRHLNGNEAMRFTRFRSDSSYYDWMLRPMCVMGAMLNRLHPITVLTKLSMISAAGQEAVSTDIPTSEIGTVMDLALKATSLRASSVAMAPPLIDVGSPDFTLIRRTVEKRIDGSEVIDELLRNVHGKGSPVQANSSSSGDSTVCQAAESGEISGAALANKVVQIALAEVGTLESPRGSDRGEPCKYQHAGCPQAWCADFASWVYKQAGAPFSGGADGGWRIASSRALADYWRKNGVWIQNPGQPVPINDPGAPQPGDVIWYPGHTNIVVSYDGKTVKTVGGNESQAVSVGTSWDVFKKAYGWGRPK